MTVFGVKTVPANRKLGTTVIACLGQTRVNVVHEQQEQINSEKIMSDNQLAGSGSVCRDPIHRVSGSTASMRSLRAKLTGSHFSVPNLPV
jgi:hypothetical protein